MAWAGAVSALTVDFLGSLQTHLWLYFTINTLHKPFRRWDADLSIRSKLPGDCNVQAERGFLFWRQRDGKCAFFPSIRAQGIPPLTRFKIKWFSYS